MLQNIAATFSAKLQIDRMRTILEQPVQEGAEAFTPDNYDITFDHVSFAYREGADVLEDVSFTARQGQVTAPHRPLRRRQIHRLQAGRPVLGRDRRQGDPGRHGHNPGWTRRCC